MKRTKVVPIRFTEAEHQIIEKAAKRNHTTMAEIIRSGGLFWAAIRHRAAEEMKDKINEKD